MAKASHPADELLPLPRLAALGLQHVLVMYAGAVAVPLVVSDALGLVPEQRTLLISADLFACGLATLVQALGVPGIGIRLPVIMGVTFASVSPILAIGSAIQGTGQPGATALLQVYGAVIAAGFFALLIAPLVSKLLRFFPPVVTGTIITVIGISLMPTGIRWIGGGSPTMKKPLEGGGFGDVPNPAFGQLDDLAIALMVIVVILLVTKFAKGFWSNIAVLLGAFLGSVVSAVLGRIDFGPVAEARWVDVVYPFAFGLPKFEVWSVVTMCIVMIVVMVESTGMFLALGDITGETIGSNRLSRGLRADGIGTIIGGVLNTFPYTSFSQNVGLVAVTGVRSRWVTVAAAIILLVLGLIPKLAAAVAVIPLCVLGGSSLVMFGMVAATGIRILAKVDYSARRNNLLVVGVGVGVGTMTLVAPNIFDQLPLALKPILDSGIARTTLVAILLNALFNGVGTNSAPHASARQLTER